MNREESRKRNYCDPTGEIESLGGNASVCFADIAYEARDTYERYYCEEVSLSDSMTHFVLGPNEALALLEWLERNKARLEGLARE